MADVLAPLFDALKQPLAGCYLISSDQPLLTREACQHVLAKATQAGYHRLPSEVIDATYDWAALTAQLAYRSLFDSQQIQILHQSQSKLTTAAQTALTAYCDQTCDRPHTTPSCSPPSRSSTAQPPLPRRCVVLCLPKLTTAQQNTTWCRHIKKQGRFIALKPPTAYGLGDWIQQRAKYHGLRFTHTAIESLKQATLGDIEVIEQILCQLNLLHGNATSNTSRNTTKTVTQTPLLDHQAIRSALQYGGEVTVFTLIQAIEQADPRLLRRVLQQLKHQGTAPPMVLWAFTRELRQWLNWSIQSQHGQPLETLVKPNWPTRIQTIKRVLARLSIPRLQQALIWAGQLDQRIKGLTLAGTTDLWEELTVFGLSLCQVSLPTSPLTP